MRRTIVTILAGLAILCVVAVIDVTLLGGDGKYRRGVARDCLTILEDRTPCGDSDAWYRVAKEKPTADGCSRGRRRSENREDCLERLDPIEVNIEVPPLPTPSR